MKSMVDLGLLSGAAPCIIQSRCGGRQLADKISAQPRPSAACRLCRLRSWGQPTSPARLHSARSAEERRALSAAARWLECVRGTDKALGESQLSRPLTRATATPSTRMCALHVCRHPCTSALARMLTRRCCASLGRLWDHSKDSCMSLVHPFAHSHLN